MKLFGFLRKRNTALVLVLAALLVLPAASVFASSDGGHGETAAHDAKAAEASDHGAEAVAEHDAEAAAGHDAEAAAHGEGHGDHHASKGWIITDTWRVLNFSVLFIALFLILRKPVANALGARIQGIREQLADLEQKKADAEQKLAEYEERIASLEKEADGIIAGYIQQGNDAKARILEEAESAAAKLEDQAKRAIEHEFQRAKDSLKEEIVEKALAKAEEIVRSSITSDDQERLVDEYLKKVVA